MGDVFVFVLAFDHAIYDGAASTGFWLSISPLVQVGFVEVVAGALQILLREQRVPRQLRGGHLANLPVAKLPMPVAAISRPLSASV